MRRVVLKSNLPPGDILMLTAAVRDLHRSYPQSFLTDVRANHPALWANNPFITPLREYEPGTEIIDCHYPLIQESNQLPYHFIHGFIFYLNEQLGLNIRPTEFRGDIYLSKEEQMDPLPFYPGSADFQSAVSPVSNRKTVRNEYQPQHAHAPLTPTLSPSDGAREELPMWLISAGGKRDFTIKWWDTRRYQEVVDHFRGRIQFVQVGAAGDYHPELKGVIDLRGRTDLRTLIKLVYHADGIVTPVSLLMHLAATVPGKRNGKCLMANDQCAMGDTKAQAPNANPKLEVASQIELSNQLRPCVVIAGGREPAHWEAYPGHQFLHTIGMLACCRNGGCWRSRTIALRDGSDLNRPERLCVDVVNKLPRCMDMIQAADVIACIEKYLAGKEHEEKIAGRLPKPPSGNVVAQVSQPAVSQVSNLQSIRSEMEKFILNIGPYPKSYQGRGIIICGGGHKYFTCAWVCIKMLRHLGCKLPVQLWYLGEREMDSQMISLLAPLGVECIDGNEVRKISSRPNPQWLGTEALLHHSFPLSGSIAPGCR